MTCTRSITIAIAASLLAMSCFAQPYPSKPIRLLVPFGPGGVGDITSRAVMQKVSENVGQQIIIPSVTPDVTASPSPSPVPSPSA